MGSITLNKPSGGQLTLSPEDGATNETVVIPSVGVGKVLQVVSSQGSTGRQTYTSSTATNIITVSITPSSVNSKLLVTAHSSLTRTGSAYIWSSIYRDSTEIHNIDTQSGYIAGSSAEHSMGAISGMVLDSPSSISALTYSLKMRIQNYTGSIFIDGQPVITVMEVAQ